MSFHAPGGPIVKYDTTASAGAVPRALITIAGITIQVQRWSFKHNAHGATDTATIAAAAISDADWSKILAKGGNDQVTPSGTLKSGVTSLPILPATDTTFDKPIPVVLRAGFVTNPASQPTASQLTLIFSGLVDSYKPNFGENEIVFEARSLASVLVQDKVQSGIDNMTSVQLLQQSAAKWGLQTDVKLQSGATPVTLSQVYAQRELVGVHNVRRWDLLKMCAQVDDVDIWERNGIIHYIAPQNIKRNTLGLRYGKSMMMLSGEHAVQFNRNIEVEVRSYTRRNRVSTWSRSSTDGDGNRVQTSGATTVTSQANFGTPGASATSTNSAGVTTNTNSMGSGGSAASGFTGTGYTESTKEKYVYNIPNLTPQQCDQRAIAIWRQISMHEYQAQFKIPVTPQNLKLLDVTTFFAISGAPYAKWNDEFWPREINFDFDISQSGSGDSPGWTATVSGVNHFLADSAV